MTTHAVMEIRVDFYQADAWESTWGLFHKKSISIIEWPLKMDWVFEWQLWRPNYISIVLRLQ